MTYEMLVEHKGILHSMHSICSARRLRKYSNANFVAHDNASSWRRPQ